MTRLRQPSVTGNGRVNSSQANNNNLIDQNSSELRTSGQQQSTGSSATASNRNNSGQQGLVVARRVRKHSTKNNQQQLTNQTTASINQSTTATTTTTATNQSIKATATTTATSTSSRLPQLQPSRLNSSDHNRPSNKLKQLSVATPSIPIEPVIRTNQPSSSSAVEPNHSKNSTDANSPLPGANIKVVVRCRGLTEQERVSDPQVVLFTGGVRGRELSVDIRSTNSISSSNGNGNGSNCPPSNLPSEATSNCTNQQATSDDRSKVVSTSNSGLTHTGFGSSLVEDPKKNSDIKTYPFDHVFGPEADQALIFTDVVSPILNEVLQGYNCTIFAYGQTGTGKTYTMTGDLSVPTSTTIIPTLKSNTDTTNPEINGNASPSPTESTPLIIPTSLTNYSNEAGIIPRVLHSLFNLLEDCSEEEKVEFGVRVSFVELYNEELRDLNYIESSDPKPPSGSTNLKIFDDSNQKKGGGAGGSGVYIQNLTETPISSAQEGIRILTLGSSRRQIAATKCNEQSSRSHSVFSITIHVKDHGNNKDGGKEDQIKIGKLNLVDLAGSENVGRSGAGKEFGRAREAGMINQSLLTLGRVINALVEKSAHVPYRESKLTRLLQDSLGGRTKTCIIATVSPSRLNLEETISTLDYALRAKSIKNRPELNNRINKSALINQYVHEIEKLRHDLIATRTKNGLYFSEDRWAEIMSESESKNRNLADSRRKIELIELELIRTKKEFENCLRVLNIRELEIKKNQDELSRKKNEFEDMKQLKEGLDEELLKERKIKDQLKVDKNRWKSQFKEVYNDNEGLRAKIARKIEVESFNQDTLREIEENLNLNSYKILKNLKEFENSFVDKLSRVNKNNLVELESKILNNIKSLKDYLGLNFNEDFQLFREALDQLIIKLESNNQIIFSGDENKEGKEEELVKNDGNIIIKQSLKHLAELKESESLKFEKVHKIISEIKSDTLVLIDDLRNSFKNSNEIVSGKIKDDQTRLFESHELEKTELKNETDKLRKEIENLKQRIKEDNRQTEEDEKDIIQFIKSKNLMHLRKRNEGDESMIKVLKGLTSAKEDKIKKVKNDENQSRLRIEDFDNKLKYESDSSNLTLQQFEARFKEGNSNLIKALENDKIATIESSQSNFESLEKIVKVMDQNRKKFLQEFETIKEVDMKENLIQKLEINYRNHSSTFITNLDSQTNVVENKVKELFNDIDKQSSLTNEYVDQSLNLISNLRDDMQLFLTKKIKKDTITGQTPRRKVFKNDYEITAGEQSGEGLNGAEEERDYEEDTKGDSTIRISCLNHRAGSHDENISNRDCQTEQLTSVDSLGDETGQSGQETEGDEEMITEKEEKHEGLKLDTNNKSKQIINSLSSTKRKRKNSIYGDKKPHHPGPIPPLEEPSERSKKDPPPSNYQKEDEYDNGKMMDEQTIVNQRKGRKRIRTSSTINPTTAKGVVEEI
ncbi:kinesin motor domain-domain-containing protein [Phakopsora pachyrhizi]|uniref:Kinesin motor domain-domain-containing protein n=1 Tax=Phakopsora pachyrhizi TaxID=170000 RepID=A0AAV0B3N9_PHAPC|nr:kinesin motor domain-domain-containing protein [Phakopsora pachyrhizi]